MSLSFREQAAIALRVTPGGGQYNCRLNDDEAVEAAQSFADKCCAKWGHDWAPTMKYLDLRGTQWRQPLSTAAREDGSACRRCGKEMTP